MENEKELMGTEPEMTEEVIEETVEETAEAVEEVTEETAEEATEAFEEAAAEAVEETAEEPKKVLEKVYLCEACGAITEDEFCPVCQKELTKEEAYVCTPKTKVEAAAKMRKNILTTVVAAVAACAVAWGGVYLYREVYNPYNHGEYKNLAFGDKLGELAKEAGMDYKLYLSEEGFPENMPKSTYVNVAEQYIPLGALVNMDQLAMYGMTFDDFLEQIGVEGDYTEDTPRGEFEAEMTIESYAGVSSEEELKEFVDYYGLEGDITLETKYGEIREQIYKKLYEKQLEEEKAAEEAETEESVETEEPETEEPVEAEEPVETEETLDAAAE